MNVGLKARRFSAALVVVLMAGTLTGAYSATAAHTGANAGSGQTAQPPAVIAGRVTSVRGSVATMATAARPVCPRPATPTPGAVRCNAIVAGASFQVDTSRAVFETAAGTPLGGSQPKLAAGDAVVVVGTRASNGASAAGAAGPLVRATVIQRAAPCTGG